MSPVAAGVLVARMDPAAWAASGSPPSTKEASLRAMPSGRANTGAPM